MWPQYLLLALVLLSAGVNLAKHGDEHPDYNFWTFAIAIGIEMWILTAGGFFKGIF